MRRTRCDRRGAGAGRPAPSTDLSFDALLVVAVPTPPPTTHVRRNSPASSPLRFARISFDSFLSFCLGIRQDRRVSPEPCAAVLTPAGSPGSRVIDGSWDPEGVAEEFSAMSRLASELHRLRRSPWEVLCSALVSCGLVLFSQLAVAIVPRLLPSISLLAMLPIAGLVFLAAILVGRFWRRFIGVAASAPLFVLFNVLFLWGVYLFVIRRDTSSLLDMLINAECALLLWGLYRILSGDPGIVAYESSFLEEAGCKDFMDAICSSEKYPSLSRVRHCNCCKANVRGYDHHCPAFGNCIGQKNHRLFMALLTGFVVAESTYTMCSTKYITRCITSGTLRTENHLSLNMVIGTMLFSVLQVAWQVVFLIWHVYGICFNIRTDEWVMSNFPCFGLFLHQLQVVFSFAVSYS